MSKQYCLINDGASGGTMIRSVEFGQEMIAGATRVDDVRKQGSEKPANWHHPQAPTLLRVVKGSHVIWVQNRGVAQSVTIQVGDQILFLDFEVDGVVEAGSHPGHWSQQGTGGLVAEKYLLEVAPDLSWLGVQVFEA